MKSRLLALLALGAVFTCCLFGLAIASGPRPADIEHLSSAQSQGDTVAQETVILREMVRFEKVGPKATIDAGGHVDETLLANWIEHCTRRARVVASGVRESQSPDGGEMKAQTVYRVTIRWDAVSAAIGPKMRVYWLSATGGKRLLNVLGSFDPDGSRRQLMIDCLEPVA